MTSNFVPTTVQEILKNKLSDIVGKQMDLLKLMKEMDEHVAKVEEQVNRMTSSDSYTSRDAIILAEDMDSLLDKLTKCYEAISCLNLKLDCDNIFSVETVSKKPFTTHSQSSETDNSSVTSGINTDSGNTVLNILQIQMEALQQQVLILQESQDNNLITRLEDLETKVTVLECDQNQAVNGARIENIETTLLLIQELCVKDEANMNNVMTELSNLRKDIISVQDDINRQDLEQDILNERIREVKNNTDNLVKLRNILNNLHGSVTQRDELTQKINQVQEDMTRFTREIGPQVTKILENTVGNQGETLTPYFVAWVSLSRKVKPGEIIQFNDVQQEWNGFNPVTSVFEAPVGGVYFFAVSVNANSQGTFTAAVMCNKAAKAYCGTSQRKDEQTSTSVILRLSAGDKVWIEAEEQTFPDGVEVGCGFSNFVGFLLK